MNIKKVASLIAPQAPHFVGDGFRVHNFIPHGNLIGMHRMDPFIMLDYNSAYEFAPSAVPKGVGVHPHRGFETVTIAYKGKVAHHDSSGGGGVINEGDVQWMTAASGVLHKEYHEEGFSKTGGLFQMVQLWVNLPAKDKMSAPKYQAITKEAIPQYTLENEAGSIAVIAGAYKSVKGAASTFTPIHIYNAKLHKGAAVDIDLPESYHTALLVIEGSIVVNGEQAVSTDHFALFENGGTTFTITASEDALVLILSGEPIAEPIVAHGPFVMNTQQEIMQAFNDFNQGKFGYLED
ncbi:short-chain dehydrogenase [Taibaiella sp. KBW10]|uniref:pirin family protein n=1 Tax=Taibaiella sp. KBW10 TaxID=2153357 RepID=UPI000F599065|nr:pirin family protein [Taibaiella sp. KBW10]RQO30222.1 short-chain dehydrogenase [Taibaiella sp. KBW10]